MSQAGKALEASRQQFEQRYPVPEGCCWNAEQDRYVLFHLKLCTLGKYERFVEHWVCWQASREAVVVELPATRNSASEDTERWNNVRNSTIGACRRAIKAQGLKVMP